MKLAPPQFGIVGTPDPGDRPLRAALRPHSLAQELGGDTVPRGAGDPQFNDPAHDGLLLEVGHSASSKPLMAVSGPATVFEARSLLLSPTWRWRNGQVRQHREDSAQEAA